MSRKRKISVGIVIALVTVLTGSALALSGVSFNIGTVASYDFGGFGPGFPIPATIQAQTFTLNPVALSQGSELCRSLSRYSDGAACRWAWPVRPGGRDGRQCFRRVPRSGAPGYEHWPRCRCDFVGDGIP